MFCSMDSGCERSSVIHIGDPTRREEPGERKTKKKKRNKKKKKKKKKKREQKKKVKKKGINCGLKSLQLQYVNYERNIFTIDKKRYTLSVVYLVTCKLCFAMVYTSKVLIEHAIESYLRLPTIINMNFNL